MADSRQASSLRLCELFVVEDDQDGSKQARCSTCGWHSYPTAYRKQAQQWADLRQENCK